MVTELKSDFKLKKDIIKSALSDEPWDLLKSDAFWKKILQGHHTSAWAHLTNNFSIVFQILWEILFCSKL